MATHQIALKSGSIPAIRSRRASRRLAIGGALLAGGLALTGLPANAATSVGATAGTAAASSVVQCTSRADPKLAAELAANIAAARASRHDTVAAWVDAPKYGITCQYNGSEHFDSASVVKVIILGTLLRVAQEQNRYLTSTEAAEAKLMITKSDNNAATYLWRRLGLANLRHFLSLTGMKQTQLGANGYWGLTQVTPHDETVLLTRLTAPNSVLDNNSRAYALNLMHEVVSSQRWGVTAGAPASVTWHVKNGWLPRATHGWRINSIGAFTFKGGWYTIVVLTMDNPTMAYGVTTVENIARVVHHDLNPTVKPAIPPSAPSPQWGKPDEVIPALPSAP